MEIIYSEFKGINIELFRRPFEDLIDQLAQGLELQSLEYIIISDDFENDLNKFQRSKGLREEFTENELGVAIAKTVPYFEAEKLETCIFLHSAILGLLFSEDSNEVLNAIQIINHELCHAQDNYLKSKIFEPDFIMNRERDFDWALKIHADSIWSEYIANKSSRRVIKISGSDINLPPQVSFEIIVNLFIESIFKIERDAKKYIDEYRIHADIRRLYLEIQESAGFLLTMMGRAYGILCCYKELIEVIDEGIMPTYAFEIWKSLCPSLDNLNSKYPNWSGVREFDELSQLVLRTWNVLGIYPRVNGNGLYVEVPFR